MTTSLIQPLMDGPLDIVGDVHGEIGPLRSLLTQLGYDSDANHSEQRRLVFVGDLTDRGPDSPAVVDLVQRLITAGRAQCVLGNHDLNLLLDHRKHENRWFYGEPFEQDGQVIPQALADADTRQRALGLFRTLPLALERADLRVVHACWNDEMVRLAQRSRDAVALYREHREHIESSFPGLDLDEIDQGLEHQNRNPVKQLTSGPEARVATPTHAGGRVRHEMRVPWWHDYRGTFCVFGHYSIPEGAPRGNAVTFCVDYGVGKRWTERKDGRTSQFEWKLAALRWPEREVVFDEGGRRLACRPTWAPGGGVVVHVLPGQRDWQLPADAATLPAFHVTLVGRKAFLGRETEMTRVWQEVQATLPDPPVPHLGRQVHLATDADRKTWFLNVINQREFHDYVRDLLTLLNRELDRLTGQGGVPPETDRYFHVSVANNQGGDPLKSIGSIQAPALGPEVAE